MIKSLNWPNPQGKQDGTFKLDRTLKALAILNNPHLDVKNIIHIGGTNGKGSSLAFLEQILLQSSFTTFSYTSPSLLCLNERFRLNSQNIADDLLAESLEEVEAKILKASPDLHASLTFFEGLTVLYFYIASKLKCNFNLVEVGLGGRFDATNVIASPLVSIITQISLDHMEYLGNTHSLIAAEKAEILKANSCSVIAKQDASDAGQIIGVFAKKAKSLQNHDIYIYDKDFKITHKTNNGFSLQFEDEVFTLPHPSLKGGHQYYNASNAVVAALLIAKKLNLQNKITWQNIFKALQCTSWLARMQTIYNTNSHEIIVDGGHNQGAIAYLEDTIKSLAGQGMQVSILYSALRRKNIAPQLQTLAALQKAGFVKDINITQIKTQEESYTPEELASAMLKNGIKCRLFAKIEDCFDDFTGGKTKDEVSDKKQILIVYGSLYLAANALQTIC